jgi:glucose/mannose-6-phosphate isomerase
MVFQSCCQLGETMLNENILDDVKQMLEIDSANMLEATASAGAQIRRALEENDLSVIRSIAASGKPRSVVVTGMGGSGISGQILEALANTGSPIPVVSSRGYGLPAWVGADDLVISLSCSGGTEETIAAAQEAARRGCRLAAITSKDSELARFVERVKGADVVYVDARGQMPRASMWTLLTPLLRIGNALGVVRVGDADLAQAADITDEVGALCAVEQQTAENPAKILALQFADSLPMIWGTGEVGPVASYRVISQLAENAKLPAIHGEIPESQHNQVVVLDGPYAGAVDPFADQSSERKFRLILLRDSVEHPQMARRAEIVTEIATQRDVPVTQVDTQGTQIVHRLAYLIALTDWASVYAGLVQNIDPSPIGPIAELKARLQA